MVLWNKTEKVKRASLTLEGGVSIFRVVLHLELLKGQVMR